MKTYKLLRLTNTMKLCGDIATIKEYDTNVEEFYSWLTQGYILKPLLCDLVYTHGEYGVIEVDDKGNYKNCKLVLVINDNEVKGYRATTAADELKIARFLGFE